MLVVDDDPGLQRMMRTVLIAEGFGVAVAGDGLAGLAALEAEQFHLVILDLQMPRMDGREMHRTMRARGIDVPTIILSAYRPEDARLELGADASILKPFDIDTLIETVESLLARPAGLVAALA